MPSSGEIQKNSSAREYYRLIRGRISTQGPLVLQEGYYIVLSGLGVSNVVSGEELLSVNI